MVAAVINLAGFMSSSLLFSSYLSTLSYLSVVPFTLGNTTHAIANESTHISDRNLCIIIGTSAFGFLLIVFAMCAICYCYNRVINRQLAAYGKQNGPVVIKIELLFKMAIDVARNRYNAKKILEEEVGTEQDDKYIERARLCDFMNEVITISTCRTPDIMCMKRSLVLVAGTVLRLHLNKLYDYYKKPIYMCQAPIDFEFTLIWKIIQTQKIGTIVWLRFPDKTVESYAKLSGGSKEIGDFKITCSLSIRSPDQEDYIVDVTPSPNASVDFESFSVIFVIAHGWNKPVKPKEMSAQCNIISFVQCHHDYMIGVNRPGLLVHHIEGVNVTAGFVASYLGRQMLLDQRRVNVTGICQYIRYHRHKAFTFEKNSAEQFQMVYMVLGTFARWFKNENPETRSSTKQEMEKYATHVSLQDSEAGMPENFTCYTTQSSRGNTLAGTQCNINKSTHKSTSKDATSVSKLTTQKISKKEKQALMFPSFVKRFENV